MNSFDLIQCEEVYANWEEMMENQIDEFCTFGKISGDMVTILAYGKDDSVVQYCGPRGMAITKLPFKVPTVLIDRI